MEKDILIYWSGGKDSAMALHEINTNQRFSGFRVKGLMTTLTDGYDRISGHGVRRSILERQAECLGLSLHKTYIPKNATMQDYESVIEEALLQHKQQGTNFAATGDIFIEKRRMATFKKTGMRGCFPLMLNDSYQHVKRFLDLGFKAYVICVDAKILDHSFVGRVLDREFIDQLPSGIDPCGENGEFHTLVVDGPIFNEELRCTLGEVVLRESFYYCDVCDD